MTKFQHDLTMWFLGSVVILLFIWLLGCASWPAEKKAFAWCLVADAATTAYALDDGASEANPLAPLAVPLGAWVLSDKDFEAGPRWAWRTSAGSHCVGAAWNLAQLENR